ncbi:hypothetical protein [Alishewanella phage vB_AspM_Slickus01]|nr:hypothetical protein [Alishewanella phage vB_AspM_Slickus01]
MIDDDSCKICKSSRNVYCIIDPSSNKLHRCSFSRSLSNWIVDTYANHLEVRTLKYRLGKKLEKGEASRGLYAIVSAKKGIVLRISVLKEHAELLCDNDSRFLQEVFLEV